MAAVIGAAPDSLSRKIQILEADGIVKFSNKIVTAPVLEKLIEEFEPDQYV